MRRDALVVGINLYASLKDTPNSKAKNLITPAVDAEKIAQLLEAEQEFRVIRLPASRINNKLQVDPNKSVSADELLEAITKLFLPSEDLDTALLFFAGHGLQKPLGTLNQTLLATSDANPQLKKWNGLLLRDLWEIIEQSTVKEQIIWLDCCYGGELLNFKENEFPNAHNRFLIAASHSSEVAYERLDGQHGVLSGALIEGLDSEKIDHQNWITVRTLGAFVDTELKKYYAETKIPQLPQIRIPDQEIRLVKGKGQPNINQQSDTNKSPEHKIPFVLPQLDISTFTGRDNELKQLEDLLLKPQGTKFCSIAGLAGVGGIGKSALACHFATLHKADFPDGVIGLRVDDKDVNSIARELVRRCGEEIDPEDERDAATIIEEVFAHRRMLLIFDNAENDSIRQLRPSGNRCAVIVTTRDRGLAISLEIPKEGRINLSPLPEADALLLLEKLIGKERVAAEPENACKLIELAGYLPIAIKIIGSQLSLHEKRSLARHAERLKKEQQLASMKFGNAEHLDLFACFSVSLEYLQPDEIDFFACLSICAKNGFSLQTAMVATACDDYATEDYLSKLYQLSLINYSELEKDRFVFHPLIHQFAVEKAIELGLQEEAAARHAEYFIKFTKREINSVAAKEIAAELDDIILTAQWLQQKKTTSKSQEKDKYKLAIRLQQFFEQYGYWEKAVDFMLGFEQLAERNEDWQAVVKFRIQQAKYLSLQGKWSAAEELLKSQLISKVLDKIEEESTRQLSKARWLNTLGGIVMRQGKFDEAIEVFKRAVEIEEQLNNQQGLAMVLNSLGGLLRRQGHLKEAEDTLNRSYIISEQLNDKRNTAMVLHNLGIVFLEQNRLDEAFYNLQRSCDIFKEFGHQRSLLMVLTSLGGVLQKQGKLDEAIAAIQESAAIEEKLADKRNLIIKLNLLGGLYQQQGQIDQAIQSFERAITIAQQIDNKQQLAITLNQLGGLYQQQGQIDQAIQSFERAITIAQQIDNKQQLAITLNQLGGLYQQQGQIDQAIQSFERRIAIAQQIDNKQSLAITLTQLGGLYQQQGRFDEAIQSFERAIAIAQETDNKQQLAITLTQLGGLYQQQGRFDEAIQSFERAIAIAQETDNKQQLAITLTQLGGLYQQQGQIAQAIQTFECGIAIAQKADNKQQLIITLSQLGGLYQQQGQFDEAIQSFKRAIAIAQETDNKQSLVMTLSQLGGLYQQQGRINEAIQSFERGIAIAQETDNKQSLAITLTQLGGLYQQQGEIDQAIQSLERVITIEQEADNKQSLAITLNQLGGLYQQQGRIDEAIQTFEYGIAIAQQIDNKQSLAITLNQLGGLYQQQGRIDEAIQTFERGIAIAQQIDNKQSLAIALSQLGGLYQQQRRIDQAIQTFERGIAIAQQIDNKQSLVMTLSQLGGLYQQQGRIDEAIQSFERGIAIAQETANKQQLAITLNQLGGLYQQQERFDEAIQTFERGIAIAQQINNKQSLAIALNKLGGLYQQQGRIDEAIQSFERGITVTEETDDKQSLAITLHRLGTLLEQQQKLYDAEKIFRRCYDISVKLDDQKGQAMILNSLGQVMHKQGGEDNFQLALMYFRESVKRGEQLNNQKHLAKAHTAMGQALLAHGDHEQAAEEFRTGFEIDESLKNSFGLGKVTPELAYTLVKLGKRQEAIAYCQRALAIPPHNQRIVELYNKVSSSKQIINPRSSETLISNTAKPLN